MAKDKYHKIVREALVKDGWKITHDPYKFSKFNPDWEIDLGAEKVIAAEKGKEKIAVEVKSFEAESFAYEFHRAMGQYMDYLPCLEVIEPERVLFLAVPDTIYATEFQRPGIVLVTTRYQVRIITFSTATKTIVQWIQ